MSTALLRKPTTATVAVQRSWAVFDQGDFDAARALCAPDFKWEDRRPLFWLSGDVELMIASARERLAIGARHQRREIIGSAGDRVAIGRVLWAGGPAGGRFEVEFLVVNEVDEAGLATAVVFFDPDDPRAALREAWARWATIDPTMAETLALVAEGNDAFNAHDRVRLRAVLADDLVVDDHRRTGMGRFTGGSAYADSIAVLWDLAAATQVELGWFWLAWAPHGALYTIRRTGDVVDGGPFESDYLQLMLHAGGRWTHTEMFEMDQCDAALARFEVLRAQPDDAESAAPQVAGRRTASAKNTRPVKRAKKRTTTKKD